MITGPNPYATKVNYDRIWSLDSLEVWLARHLKEGDIVRASACADRILALKGFR